MICLAVDAAKASGWAVFLGGRLVASGDTKRPAAEVEAVRRFVSLIPEGTKKVCVVYEVHMFGPRKTFTSLNRSSGRWIGMAHALTPPGVKVREVGIGPDAWRKHWHCPFSDRDTIKPWAIKCAHAAFGVPLPLSDDRAEAILLGGYFSNCKPHHGLPEPAKRVVRRRRAESA